MKKLLCTAFALVAACTAAAPIGSVSARAEELASNCKAAYLCDFATGTKVYSKEEEKRLPVASMCKIMTLVLSFEAVESGNLSFGEKLTVSERAAGMGGSQVFLDAGLSYTAEELMKTVAVCSANDSCVALAERIAGSEEGFVAKMNARAKELGAENTLFANCTGLPKEPQYSCAKDVAIMLRALLTHQKYFEFSTIWLEDFAHPDGRTTTITNTNKLIRQYEGCDGGKTGFTNEAGFCLAATAKRGDTRLISVVIGGQDSKSRFSAVKGMFDMCFATYESRTILEAGVPLEGKTEIKGSRKKEIEIVAKENLQTFEKRGEEGECQLEIELQEGLGAPIAKGDKVGRAVLYRGGVEIAATDLLAAEDAPRLSWWDALRETARDWQ